MSLPASTTSSSMGGTAQEGNGLDRELEKEVLGGPFGSKDKEDGAGASNAVRASPFDCLPDELVSAILDFVAEDRRNKLDSVCLNRRMARLAVSAWAAALRPFSLDVQSRLLQQLNLRPHLHPLVRRVELYIHSNLAIFTYDCTILRLFRRLSSLALRTAGRAVDILLEGMQQEMESQDGLLPLSRLSFGNDILVKEDAIFDLAHDKRQSPVIFNLVRTCRIPRPKLCIGARSEVAVPKDLPFLPHVRNLTLTAYEFEANTKDATRALTSLILLFPSLTDLVLLGAVYGPDDHVTSFADPSIPSFFFNRSHLLTLLHSFRPTSILRFNWRTIGDVEYRWHRSTTTEEFAVEVLRPF